MEKTVKLTVIENNDGSLRGKFPKTKANIEFAELLGFFSNGFFGGEITTKEHYEKELRGFLAGLAKVKDVEIQNKGGELTVSAVVTVSDPVYKLRVFEDGDAAHWNPNDLGIKQLRSLKRAIARKNDFTTGWYSCKKEGVSTRIMRIGEVYKVGVSVCGDGDEEASVEETVVAQGKPAEVWAILERVIEKNAREAWAAL